MIDENLLSDGQRHAIRIWAQVIRAANEERAVRILTKLVTNLAGDQLALNAILREMPGKLPN
jgi:hypothetical protein